MTTNLPREKDGGVTDVEQFESVSPKTSMHAVRDINGVATPTNEVKDGKRSGDLVKKDRKDDKKDRGKEKRREKAKEEVDRDPMFGECANDAIEIMRGRAEKDGKEKGKR